MSWRVITTVFIVVFAALIVWTITADPLRQTGDSIAEIDDGGGPYDVGSQTDSIIRGFSNMFLVLVFGVLGWGLWRVLRRELTRGGGGQL